MSKAEAKERCDANGLREAPDAGLWPAGRRSGLMTRGVVLFRICAGLNRRTRTMIHANPTSYEAAMTLPLALAELGLIDEYEFVVHPRLAGHGPTPFAGLSQHVDLQLVNRLEFASGAVAMRYEPRT